MSVALFWMMMSGRSLIRSEMMPRGCTVTAAASVEQAAAVVSMSAWRALVDG